MSKRYRDQTTLLEIIFTSVFKALWFLITLPFKGIKNKKRLSSDDKAEIFSRRQEIESLLNSENELELKHAVMEADKLVDYVLKLKGYNGQTFADRLRSAENYIDRDTYQSIWAGHKVRNILAHEHQNGISKNELTKATINLLKYLKNM